MTRILDSHIHAYPAEVAANPRAWGLAQGEAWWVETVAPAGRPSIQGWADVDQLLRDMDAGGVEQVVMLGWYWERLETCRRQNDWFSAWHRAHPDRIQGFAATQPAAGAAALDEVRRAFDAGLRGIGELLPGVQGFDPTGEKFGALATLAAEAGVPINLHVTDPTLNNRPGMVATPLEDYVTMASAHPATTFILAHWGGGLPFHELSPRVQRALRNVFYDTSASPLIYDPAIFTRVVELIGHERILYGSDYPLRLYPKTGSRPAFDRFIADIRAEGLPAPAFDAIMGGNLRRLLNLA